MGIGPEGPQPLCLVMELNAIHLEQEQCRAAALHHAEICEVTTALEGSFVFNLCHEHMQIINCFSSG